MAEAFISCKSTPKPTGSQHMQWVPTSAGGLHRLLGVEIVIVFLRGHTETTVPRLSPLGRAGSAPSGMGDRCCEALMLLLPLFLSSLDLASKSISEEGFYGIRA